MKTNSKVQKLYKFRYSLIFLILVSFFSLGISVSQKATNNISEEESQNNEKFEEVKTKESFCLGKVIKILTDIEEELPGGNKQRIQNLLLQIVSGEDKGKKRHAENIIPDNPAFAIVGKINKEYLINKVENLQTGDEEYFVVDYYREPLIWILCVLFIVSLLLVGGTKGIRAIISLIITILLISFVLIPLVEKGVNPLLGAVLVSSLATLITMILVAGLNKKSLASTLGTAIGVSISGVIATIIIKIAPLSGLSSSEAMILWGSQFTQTNFKGLLAAGMIVSCLGAVMDVAISIASSIQEIKIANPTYSIKQLFNSGMNVGKDIMGTMTNTLVLAYTGMALPLLILISHESNPSKFLNLELVMSEITAAIAGSIGLIIAIPATAFIMSYLVGKNSRSE